MIYPEVLSNNQMEKLQTTVSSTIEGGNSSKFNSHRRYKNKNNDRNHNSHKRKRDFESNDEIYEKKLRKESQTVPPKDSVKYINVEEYNKESTPTNDAYPLEQAFIGFLKAVTPTVHEREETRRVLHDMGRSLSYLDMHVVLFGSWCTGLCIPSSDIDFIAIPKDSGVKKDSEYNNNNNNKSRKNNSHAHAVFQQLSEGLESAFMSRRQRLTLFASALRIVANNLRSSRLFHNVTQITGAKVPIVKSIHREGQKVDVSFVKDGLLTSYFLCEEFKKPQFRLARGLIILLKALIANSSLDDPSVGGLGSFPTAVMVLWFLHTEVAEKYPDDCSNSYAVCFVGLLKYYSIQFDYKTSGIDYANKRIFAKPPSMELYVMNPIMPHVNCAGAASLFASQVAPKFREAYKILSGLLEYKVDNQRVENAMLQVFGKALNAVGGIRLLRDKQRQELTSSTNTQQHMWEERTGLYLGDPVGF